MSNETNPDFPLPPVQQFWQALADQLEAEWLRLPEVKFPPHPSTPPAEQTIVAHLLAAEQEWWDQTTKAAVEFVACGVCVIHPRQEVLYFLRARLRFGYELAASCSTPTFDGDSPMAPAGLSEEKALDWILISAWSYFGNKLWASTLAARVAYGDTMEAAGVEQALKLAAPAPAPVEAPEKTLARVVIPAVYLEDVTLEEALAAIYDLACAADSTAARVHPVARRDAVAVTEGIQADFDYRDIPYAEALTHVAEALGLRVLVGPTCYLVPQESMAQELITREYAGVPVAFFEGETISSRAKVWFQDHGVAFENGADLTYSPTSERLWIRNVWPELDQCEQLLLAAGVDTDPLASLGEV